MLERSESGKYSKSVFYRPFNDIEIFVEDTALESRKIYTEIMRRIVGSTVSINQIFPIGPKSTVIKRCKNDQNDRDRPAVYIVDGDYEILLGIQKPQLKRFYRINRYCIENFLLDEEAIIDSLNDDSIDLDRDQIRDQLQYTNWERYASPLLGKLAVALGAAHKNQCDGLPTVRIDLNKIAGDHFDHIDRSKVEALLLEYSKRIDSVHGIGCFEKSLSDIYSLLPAGVSDYRKHCSAKNFAMPFITSRIKRRLNIELDYRKFKIKLALRCNIRELKDILDCIC